MRLRDGCSVVSHPDLTPRIIAQVVGEKTWLCLKYYYGIGTVKLTSKEISERLGIAQFTVVRRAGKGLSILHDYLESLARLREYING